ncbi:MAG: UvrD-helicase domain-containing protein [Christensenellales bacterium]
MRASLRAQYRYVFIDEYQDSSAIQEAIVGSFAREDGLFLVGDVKQSIYRFRQAEPSLFLQKAARFDLPERGKERRIDLQKNFRSRANVLEAANAVFGRIMRAEETEIEYDEREKLFCGLPAREDDPPVELHVLYQPGEDGAEEDENAERNWPPSSGRRRLSPRASASWSARRFTTRRPRRKGRCAIAI